MYLESINDNYKKYCDLTKMNYKKIEYDTQVLEYEVVILQWQRRNSKGILINIIDELTDELILKGTDKREIPLEITKKLMSIAQLKMPTIVIFLQHHIVHIIHLMDEVDSEKEIFDSISEIAKEFGEKSKEELQSNEIFP